MALPPIYVNASRVISSVAVFRQRNINSSRSHEPRALGTAVTELLQSNEFGAGAGAINKQEARDWAQVVSRPDLPQGDMPHSTLPHPPQRLRFLISCVACSSGATRVGDRKLMRAFLLQIGGPLLGTSSLTPLPLPTLSSVS